jgi:iron complex outermembrane receptor protein
MQQCGEKRAPYKVNLPLSATGTNQRYWAWPYWDLDSLYFLSTTRLAPTTLRTRLYVNTFENLLRSFANPEQTLQNHQRAFDSYYDDTAYGGSARVDTALGANGTLRGSFNYRRDEHNERNAPGFAGGAALQFNEPWQTTEEDTFSLALENTYRFGANVDWIVGVSHDWTDLRQAEDVSNAVVSGNVVLTEISYPLFDMDATNWQTALTYRVSDTARIYASISWRSRFPTQFERFSTRMGTAEPNPTIGPERAINYEIGGAADVRLGVRLEGALFYSDLQNALAPAIVPASSGVGAVTQTQNFASAEYYGGEASLTAELSDGLRVGANYTYIHRDYSDPGNPAFEPEGVPEHQVFIYAAWDITDVLTFTPSVEIASERWTANAATPATPPYYETGDYALLNAALSWQVTPLAELLFGVRNLADENYQLADGLPEEGRNLYLSLRLSN